VLALLLNTEIAKATKKGAALDVIERRILLNAR